MEKIKQSIEWANRDIEVYYNFLNSKNPTGYTICPIYSHKNDKDEFKEYDLIQQKHNKENKYNSVFQFIELKGRINHSIAGKETAIIDYGKILELQEYGKAKNMDVFVVYIWYQDNIITIHKIDLYKDYSKYSEIFENINLQTAGKEKKGRKKIVHLPLYNDNNVRQYRFNCNVNFQP